MCLLHVRGHACATSHSIPPTVGTHPSHKHAHHRRCHSCVCACHCALWLMVDATALMRWCAAYESNKYCDTYDHAENHDDIPSLEACEQLCSSPGLQASSHRRLGATTTSTSSSMATLKCNAISYDAAHKNCSLYHECHQSETDGCCGKVLWRKGELKMLPM
jgi:hypothetical protein